MTNEGRLPPNFEDNIKDAAMLTSDLIGRMGGIFSDIATRWTDGLSPNDVDAITANMGRNLSEFSALIYQTMEQNVTPANQAESDT